MRSELSMTRRMLQAISMFACVSSYGLACASETDSPGDTAPQLAPPPGTVDLAGFGLSMIVVLAAIVGLGWLYSRSRGLRSGASDVINVLASRPLGAKERLLLIDVAGQQLLVGMTAAEVRTLHVFDEPIDVDSGQADTGRFAARLKSALAGAAR